MCGRCLSRDRRQWVIGDRDCEFPVPFILHYRIIAIATKASFLETLLKSKLEESAQGIVTSLLPKYKAEAEALLEKAANRMLKKIIADLVIVDQTSYLQVTIPEVKTIQSSDVMGKI